MIDSMSNTTLVLSWISNRIGKPPGWERVVRMLSSPEKCQSMRELCVVREGIAFLAQPALPLGWHVALFGTYEPEVREIVRAVLPQGGVAFDIGANVGWHTLLMARLVGNSGRVLAAEANPSVRSRLQDNLSLNRFGQVEVIPFAIANSEKSVEFYGPNADDIDSGSGYVIVGEVRERQANIRVETRCLDAVVSAARVERLDLIKIDVEGLEWPVLQGGQSTIAKFRPHIVFEYNSEYSVRGEGSPSAIAEFFRVHRYRLFAIGRTWAQALESENWPGCTDIWAVPLA
jgi:FkbM family methyltransferase